MNAGKNHVHDADERRGGRRWHVKIWAEEKSENSFFFHLIANLSEGGLFLEKKIPFKTGAKVHLEFTLPDSGDTLHIEGTIIDNYRDPESDIIGAGVQFTNIDGPLKKKIAHFLKRMEKVPEQAEKP